MHTFNGTINVVVAGATNALRQTNSTNEQAIFKHFVPFTDFITEISNTQGDNEKDLDV